MNNHYPALIENALERYLPSLDCRERKLIESMRYSLEAGGKRVRPMLVLAFNALCGGKTKAALPFVTKPASVRELGREQERLFTLGADAHDFYVLSYTSLEERRPGADWRIGPRILEA